MQWKIRSRRVDVERPFVVGILNVTPDSFSDGGKFAAVRAALAHTRRMLDEGADAIDVGGESTRPQGAVEVSVDEEIDRVIPVLRVLRDEFPNAIFSVDTTKSEVARAAIDVGVDIINDVSGFRIDPRIGEIAAESGAGVVLMHSRGGVREMGTYQFAHYGPDVVEDVISELRASVRAALSLGIDPGSIVLDPGIGFAKRHEHSLRVLGELDRIAALGYPVLVGVSRKRFVGELSKVHAAEDRVAGTIGANVAALIRGARMFRVHDVTENRQALDVAWGIVNAMSSDSRFPIPDSRR